MSSSIKVVAAIIRDGEQILACRRTADRSAGGKWEFPGGKIEADESLEEALVREISEELDVQVSVGVLVDRSITYVGEVGIDLACYEAALISPRPTQSTDHDLLEWIGPDDLPALDWAEPDLPAVRALAAGHREPK